MSAVERDVASEASLRDSLHCTSRLRDSGRVLGRRFVLESCYSSFLVRAVSGPVFLPRCLDKSRLVPGSPNGMAYRVYSLPGHAHQRICMPGRCAKLELRRKLCSRSCVYAIVSIVSDRG